MNAPTTVARLSCDEPTARRLAAFLGESLDNADSACAAYEDDAGHWQVAIHFRNFPDEAGLRELVRLAAGETAADALSIEHVAANDWVAESLAGLKPVRAGRFVVHGAHDRAGLSANDIGIEIEAALAFGTGHHGTTRGCLLALDDLTKRRRALNVLDIGTGTGVLAIAAARLLRARVVAGDIDPVAVRAARENARQNHAASMISFVRAAGVRAQVIRERGPFDLIFANILMGPLTRLATPVRKLAAPGAHVVLSGLLPSHANAIVSIYGAQGLVLERRIALEGWVTLVMRRPAASRKPKKQNRPGRGHRGGFAGQTAVVSR
jgi:ribosomal protein L11 methyltransferase